MPGEIFGPRKKTPEQLVNQQKRIANKIATRTEKLVNSGIISDTNTQGNTMELQDGIKGTKHVLHIREKPINKVIKTQTSTHGRMFKSVYEKPLPEYDQQEAEGKLEWIESGSDNDIKNDGSARATYGSGEGNVISHERNRLLSPDETIKIAAKIAKEQWRELDRREEKAKPITSVRAKKVLDA